MSNENKRLLVNMPKMVSICILHLTMKAKHSENLELCFAYKRYADKI